MNFAEIKLNGKKHLVKNCFKCFSASVFPYVCIVALTSFNYYLYIFLKTVPFENSPLVSSYAAQLRATLLTVSVCISACFCIIAKFLSERYIFIKSRTKNATLRQIFKKLSFRQCVTAVTVGILKFYLYLMWAVFYIFPSVFVGAALYFALRDGYSQKVIITLFASTVLLFLTGTVFLYITLKRYSMCNAVLFTTREADAFKIIAQSCEIMEGNTKRYALFKISFLGWKAACIAIIPLFYVLPYIQISKFNYYNYLTGFKQYEKITQKPIVFCVPQKA